MGCISSPRTVRTLTITLPFLPLLMDDDANSYTCTHHLVPSSYTSLNVFLQDVPAGDDYFLICLNSTHGVTYAVSSRFTVANSSTSGNPNPVSAPTVTVSGTPDPLKLFATTLGPAANGVRGFLAGDERGVWGVLVVLGVAVVSGVWTLW